MQYVTYEGLFVYTQTIFAMITAITGVIALVIAIVKLKDSHKRNNNKKSKK